MSDSWNSPGQNSGVGILSLLQGIFPIQGSNPGLPHCGWILYQLSHKGNPRILEWVAYPFSRGSSRPRDQPRSPALQEDSLPTEPQGKPKSVLQPQMSRCLPHKAFPGNLPPLLDSKSFNRQLGHPQLWVPGMLTPIPRGLRIN